MSSKYDETVNQFNFGDTVKEKGRNQIMKIISNIPGGSFSDIAHYLKTDKFLCEWKDNNGELKYETFNGSDLESA